MIFFLIECLFCKPAQDISQLMQSKNVNKIVNKYKICLEQLSFI